MQRKREKERERVEVNEADYSFDAVVCCHVK